LCVYTGGSGATPCEHNYRIRNKLVEQERFIDSVTVKSAMLKDNFLLKGFMAFCVSLVSGETADCYAKEY